MSAIKTLAMILIVGGGLGLAYGGFRHTKETHTADIGSLHLEVKHKERVNIPLWAGLAALIGGGLLLVVPRKSQGRMPLALPRRVVKRRRNPPSGY